jgi:hypothetical protein
MKAVNEDNSVRTIKNNTDGVYPRMSKPGDYFYCKYVPTEYRLRMQPKENEMNKEYTQREWDRAVGYGTPSSKSKVSFPYIPRAVWITSPDDEGWFTAYIDVPDEGYEYEILWREDDPLNLNWAEITRASSGIMEYGNSGSDSVDYFVEVLEKNGYIE